MLQWRDITSDPNWQNRPDETDEVALQRRMAIRDRFYDRVVAPRIAGKYGTPDAIDRAQFLFARETNKDLGIKIGLGGPKNIPGGNTIEQVLEDWAVKQGLKNDEHYGHYGI